MRKSEPGLHPQGKTGVATKTLAVWALMAGVLLGAIVAYWPALDAGFVFDDEPNILESPGLHWDRVDAKALRGLLDADQVKLPRRVVANGSLAVNYRIGGLDPRGYHAANIAMHMVVGLVLFWVLQIYLLPRSDGVAAALAAGLFLLHPLATQSVTYVVQRMTVLAALFSLVSIGCWWTGRRTEGYRRRAGWFVGATAAWVVALMSKENAALVPVVLVVHEYAFHRAAWRAWMVERLRTPRRVLLWAGGTTLSLLTLGWVLVRVYGGVSRLTFGVPFPGRDFDAWERVLTQARVLWKYVALMMWPAPSALNLDHHVVVSRGLLEPVTTLVAVAAWVLVGAAVLWLLEVSPRWGFPVVAYLVFHVIEAGPIGLELMFEHRMYLPMAMLTLLVAEIVSTRSATVRLIWVVGGIAVILALATATYQRNQVWSDPLRLHGDIVEKSPKKFRPRFNFGTRLGMSGQVRRAIPEFLEAIRVDPEHSEAHNQLGNCYLILGQKIRAEAMYREAVELDPENAAAVYNLARVLENRGARSEARSYFERFVEIAPPILQGRVDEVRRRIGR